MLVADGACFARILSFLFESNALLVYASYRQKRRELRLACCVIEGLKGVECWWLKAKWLELRLISGHLFAYAIHTCFAFHPCKKDDLLRLLVLV